MTTEKSQRRPKLQSAGRTAAVSVEVTRELFARLVALANPMSATPNVEDIVSRMGAFLLRQRCK